MLSTRHCGFGRHGFACPSVLLDRPNKPCLPALAVCLGLAVFSSAALAQDQPIPGGLSSGLDISTQTRFQIWRTTTLGSYKGVDFIAMPSMQRKLKLAMPPTRSWAGPRFLT